MNLFRTIRSFYQNPYINPSVATLRHIGWQFRKGLNLFPYDLMLSNFMVRIADRSIANGCGALLNAMGYYDPNNMYFLEELFEKNLFNSFFDIGANIGIYSLIAANTGNVKVVAFEPHPYTFSLLKENITLNLLDDHIKSVHSALGDEDGEIYLTDEPGSAINRIVKEKEYAQRKISVKLIRGHTFCRAENLSPSIMKIDVEGYENSVLRGFESILKGVQLIFIECKSMDETDSILCGRFGFLGPYKVDYRRRKFIKADINSEDWIFVNPQALKSLEVAGFLFDSSNESKKPFNLAVSESQGG